MDLGENSWYFESIFLFFLWSYLVGCKTINLPYKKCAYLYHISFSINFHAYFSGLEYQMSQFFICKNQWSILSTWLLRFSWWAFFWALHQWALIWIRTRINVEGKSTYLKSKHLKKNSLFSYFRATMLYNFFLYII